MKVGDSTVFMNYPLYLKIGEYFQWNDIKEKDITFEQIQELKNDDEFIFVIDGHEHSDRLQNLLDIQVFY